MNDSFDDDCCDDLDEASCLDPRASLEAWLEGASREELVQRILEVEVRESQLEDAFKPAVKWLSDRFRYATSEFLEQRGVLTALDLSDRNSIVQVLLELAQQGARVAAAAWQVESFLSDYRPDLIAQMIAYRRVTLTRVTNDWPAAALTDYLRNTLVDRIDCPVRTGYAHLPTIQYWAGVLEVYSPQEFNILRDHETVDRDTGEKEFAEGLAVGLAGDLPPSPYPYKSFKQAMWSQGYLRGSNDRRWQQLTGAPPNPPVDELPRLES